MEEICILWFRQDLRLEDNPALIEANDSGLNILPIYILDDVNSDKWKIGSASRWWLNESLKKLNTINGMQSIEKVSQDILNIL